MHRTTIRLDDDLLVQAKELAARTNRSLTKVIEDSLREAIGRGIDTPRRRRTKFPTFGGDAMLPGVDLDRSETLRDLMDADDDSHRR